MITAIHHVQITIPRGREADARAFYCDVLGLPEIEKPEVLNRNGGLWVQAGDRQMHVGVEDGVDRHKTKAHIAYAVTDIAAWRRRLESEGIRIEEQTAIPGMIRFEFRDPFGNRVELTQPTS